MPDRTETAINLTTYDPSYYEKRGTVHHLEYYDGPLLSAQMCVADGGTHMVEVIADQSVPETDGRAIYYRLSREDLQRMLRILDEEPVDNPKTCENGCTSCYPSPHENRDE